MPQLYLLPRRTGVAVPADDQDFGMPVKGTIEANKDETLVQLVGASIGVLSV